MLANRLLQIILLATLLGASFAENTPISPSLKKFPTPKKGVVTAQADGLPDLILLADGVFIVNRPITYTNSTHRTHPYRITVPRGFVTDLASIPWIAQLFVPKNESHSNPAILHDYLYWEQQCSREEADSLLLLEMEDAQVGSMRRWLIDTGLWLGGWTGWDENRGKREQGYIRVISRERFPCPPGKPCNTNTRWDELQHQLFEDGVRRIPSRPPNGPLAFCAAGLANKSSSEE